MMKILLMMKLSRSTTKLNVREWKKIRNIMAKGSRRTLGALPGRHLLEHTDTSKWYLFAQ